MATAYRATPDVHGCRHMYVRARSRWFVPTVRCEYYFARHKPQCSCREQIRPVDGLTSYIQRVEGKLLLAVRIFGPCGMEVTNGVSNGRNGGDTLVELPFSTSCGPSGDVPPARTGQRQICTNILVCMYARWATGRSLSRSHNVVEQCTEDGTAPLSVSLS